MTTRYETTKIETAIAICRIETIYSIGFGNYLGSFDLSVDSQIRTISTQIDVGPCFLCPHVCDRDTPPDLHQVSCTLLYFDNKLQNN